MYKHDGSFCISSLNERSNETQSFVFGAEVKQKFGDSCSVQVYSVQACIPNDPAALWNAEFVQAEELFDQPSTVENCLRDNRYPGILYSSL